MVEWKTIGSLLERKRVKAKDEMIPVYAVTNNAGFVLSASLHDFTIHSEDTSNYLVVTKNDFAYNPSRLNIGSIAYFDKEGKGLISPMYVVFHADESKILAKYLFIVIKSENVRNKIDSLKEVGARFRFDFSRWELIQIPIPSLSEQQRIVGILDTFASSIENLKEQIAQRRKQYEYYRDQLLDLEGKEGVEMKTLGEIGNVCMCKRIMKEQTSEEGEIPFFKIGTFGSQADAFISRDLFEEYKSKYSYPKKGEILISAAGTIGRSVVFDGEDAYFQDSNIVWIANNEDLVTNRYLYYFYQIAEWKTDGGTIKRLYNYNLKNTPILVPSISEQQRIVSILDTFEASINNLEQQLAQREKQYEFYRNKLLTFE